MSISSIGSGAANINMGVVSRPFGQDDGDTDHDNGRRVRGSQDSFRSDFRSLLEAVQSGDMTSAQSELASIKSDVGSPNATYSPASVPPISSTQTVDPKSADSASTDPSSSASTTQSTTSPASTVGSDLQALFDAVGSGDASTAQTALSKFFTDRQAAWQQARSDSASPQGQQPSQHVGGHHHHGHHHGGLESVIASLFSNSSSSTASTTTASTTTDPTTTVDSTTASGSAAPVTATA